MVHEPSFTEQKTRLKLSIELCTDMNNFWRST